MRLDAKTTTTDADKVQLFAESVERDFGVQSDNFDSKHFDEINQFIEDNYEYFYPPEEQRFLLQVLLQLHFHGNVFIFIYSTGEILLVATCAFPGGQLVDFYDGGDRVHIWGLKFRKDQHIWGLGF